MRAIQLTAATTILLVISLVTPAVAHIPPHCSTTQVMNITLEKLEIMTALNNSLKRQSPLEIIQDVGRLFEVEGRSSQALTEFTNCVKDE